MAAPIAQELAKQQKEISIAEFFERNKQVLGFDSPTRALITATKEAVDNSLDACEEASVLPDITVELNPVGDAEDEFQLIVEDNGPGVVKRQIPNVFGRLLYGSRFHAIRQSLHGEERVLVEKDGRVSLVPIGSLVDDHLRPGRETATVKGLRVPAFDPDGNYGMRDVSHVIRHRRETPVVEVGLRTGRRIRVTDCHSLFTLDPDSREVVEVAAGELKPGSLVVAPRRLPSGEVLGELNLLRELAGTEAPPGVYVYGIPDSVMDAVFARAQKERSRDAGGRMREWLVIRTPAGREHRVFADSVKLNYRPKGFLPLKLVLELGLEDALAGARLRTYHHGKPMEFPVVQPYSETLGLVLGLYTAEGHVDRRQIGFTLGAHETDLVKRLVEALESLGLSVSVNDHHESAVRVKAFGGVWPQLIAKWCGKSAYGKKVPSFLFQSPEVCRRSYLEALYAGDGHRIKESNEATLTTVSAQLADDVSYLWSLEGVVASSWSNVSDRGLSGRETRTHRVSVFGSNIEILGHDVIKGAKSRASRLDMVPTETLVPGATGRFDPHGPGRLFPKRLQKLMEHVQARPADRQGLKEAGIHGLSVNALVEKGLVVESDSGLVQVSGAGREFMERLDWSKQFVKNDLVLLEVESVTRLQEQPEFVYDLAVPGCENFVGGVGGVACHNSRGQQGIGVSAVVLYSQLTTGNHAFVTSRIAKDRPAHRVELAINAKKNEAEVVNESRADWEKSHGTRIEVVMTGRYVAGKQSVLEYLRSTSIVNPHANIVFKDPKGVVHTFARATEELPDKSQEIKPHPLGVERGTILKMARDTKARKMSAFLRTDFSSVGSRTVKDVLKMADIPESRKPAELSRDEVKRLVASFPKVKIMAPPTNCLAPIGDALVKRGLRKETVDVSPEFIVTATRSPAVYSGHPFQVEVGIVYGGKLPKEESVRVLRFANRVPLLYQQGGCGLTKALEGIDWRRYGLDQRGGRGLPSGPAIFAVHVASTKVPFTSEAKEAVAPIDEIVEEVKRALRDCARHMSRHLRKKDKRAKTKEKFKLISQVLPEIANKSAKMLNKPVPDLTKIICKIMDVVWIEDTVEYEKATGSRAEKGRARSAEGGKGQTTLMMGEGDEQAAVPVKDMVITVSKIEVTNYMLKPRKFRLFAAIPENAKVGDVEPEPVQVAERYIAWDLPKMESTEKLEIKFELAGLGKGDFDRNELFVKGINDVHVVGADEWHGGE